MGSSNSSGSKPAFPRARLNLHFRTVVTAALSSRGERELTTRIFVTFPFALTVMARRISPAMPFFLSSPKYGGRRDIRELTMPFQLMTVPLLLVRNPPEPTSPRSEIGPGHSFGEPYETSAVSSTGGLAGGSKIHCL